GHLAGPLRVEVRDRHPSALGRQTPNRCRADARRAPGDEGAASFQPHGGASLYCAAVSSEPAPVAIVGGTGALGFGLALRFAGAGTPVVVGSRDAERAQEAAERVRGRLADDAPARGAVNQEAV